MIGQFLENFGKLEITSVYPIYQIQRGIATVTISSDMDNADRWSWQNLFPLYRSLRSDPIRKDLVNGMQISYSPKKKAIKCCTGRNDRVSAFPALDRVRSYTKILRLLSSWPGPFTSLSFFLSVKHMRQLEHYFMLSWLHHGANLHSSSGSANVLFHRSQG